MFFENFNGALALLVCFSSCSPAFFAPLSGGREWGRGGRDRRCVGSEAFGKPTNGARKDVEKRKHEREKRKSLLAETSGLRNRKTQRKKKPTLSPKQRVASPFGELQGWHRARSRKRTAQDRLLRAKSSGLRRR